MPDLSWIFYIPKSLCYLNRLRTQRVGILIYPVVFPVAVVVYLRDHIVSIP
jgi:hypothetical protein